MNVLFLLGALNSGGKEVLLLDILSQKTLPFNAICVYRKDGNLTEQYNNSGKRIIKISNSNKLRFIKNFRRVVIDNRIDVIHAQSSFDACLAKISVMFTSIPVVQTIHGMDFSTKNRRFNLQKNMIALCNKTVFVSDFQKEHYVRHYHLRSALSEKCTRVYNGINPEKFLSAYFIDLPSNDSHKLKIATVGNFVAGRRHILICKFLNLLHKNNIDFDFYFVGGNNEKGNWRFDECFNYCSTNNILDSVHFLGKRNDVPNILKSVDAFVYSSEEDTFGISTIEAIIAGLPVFVNDWIVMNEVTLCGKLATLYKSGDETDLFRKFEKFFSLEPLKRRQIVQERQKLAMESFSITSHLNNLNSIYNEL